MVKIQQIEAHSSRSHGRDSNMASQLSQAREYWLKELSSDAVECSVDANAVGNLTNDIAKLNLDRIHIAHKVQSLESPRLEGLAGDSNQPRFQGLAEL